MQIKVMDTILSNKIAAGEVVEKCASVVKELAENSIDANSTEIKITLIDSGTSLIKITDNGLGMDKEDAILCFQRHATSKVKTEQDLFSISTLGFRGEALAAISSVSEIKLTTCTENIGTIVNVLNGKVVNTEIGDARIGTIIEIKNLFHNTPARLKYLKSLYTELSNITDLINKLALSNPHIRFTLINNDQVIFQTDGTNQLKVINSIYGTNVAKNMYQINGENQDFEVTGYISTPNINRSSRNHITTLVNGRIVRNSQVNKCINEAYHTYKPDNRYPIVVLNITVDTTQVDVNIHPTKQDINFSKINELLILLNQLIKEKLRNTNLIPEVSIFKPTEEIITNSNEFNKSQISITPIVTQVQNNNLNQEEIIEIQEPNQKFYQPQIDFTVKEDTEIYDVLPYLEPIGSVHGTYIICQNEIGMYLIDQHAAKERVNYELFKKSLDNPSKLKKDLLIPIVLEYTPSEYIILKENISILLNIGFELEEFGINSIIIKAHPIWLNNIQPQINKIIESIIQKEKKFTFEKYNDNLAHDLACKASIKGNTNISLQEAEDLIKDLKKCKNPFTCPHGRPTIIIYTKEDLEKLFKRSGFESKK